jgi:hypothetical protein
VYFTGRGAMTVETNSRNATARMHDNQGKLDLIGDRLTEHRARLMTRSVWKSTLELLYWDVGRDAFDPALDSMRAAVLDDQSHGWAVVPKHGVPSEAINLEYQHTLIDGRDALPTKMGVFGVVFLTDALRPDLPDERMPPDISNLWRF